MHIHELRLAAGGLTQLREFYTQALGLAALESSSAQLALRAGATRLVFDAAPGTRPFYHFAFNIPPLSFAAARDWLAPRVPLIADQAGETLFHSESWDADMLYFYDPAGNILELIARHSLPAHGDTPFGSGSLLSISEIGVVCDHVPTTARQIAVATGAQVYRDSLGDSFGAVGDEHGLLILVQRERVWFPDTGKPAVAAPLRASVSLAPGRPRYTLEGMPPAITPA